MVAMSDAASNVVIDDAALDPALWQYRGEGNANIVFSALLHTTTPRSCSPARSQHNPTGTGFGSDRLTLLCLHRPLPHSAHRA